LDCRNLSRLEQFNKMKAPSVSPAFFDRLVDEFCRSFDIAEQQVRLWLRAEDVTSSLFFSSESALPWISGMARRIRVIMGDRSSPAGDPNQPRPR
jgi:hypothetical protein